MTTWDLSACCCNVTVPCCGSESIPRNLFSTLDFDWSTTDYFGITSTLTYDSGNDWWQGTATCNGSAFTVRLYCSTDVWLFDLIVGGVSYGNPSINAAGGCGSVTCSPFEATGQISSGYPASMFPFCGQVDPATIDNFTITITE
jgi:hypothetical protein